jgi:O-antigen ligase
VANPAASRAETSRARTTAATLAKCSISTVELVLSNVCVPDSFAIEQAMPAAGPLAARERAVPGETAARAPKLAATALMLLPGALIVFTGFDAGGYFPATPAIAAIVLAQVLLVRIMQAPRPFEGLAPSTIVALAALALYALMTLGSAAWSHSTGRALTEFDRVWTYLLIFVLLGSVRANAQRLRWLVRGLALGALIVCLAGLISRLLPDVWHTAPDVSNQRLSYPVTYWNALGLLAALGVVFAFHLACTLGERRAVQVLAAAASPLLAATLFFTFSRGAIAAGAIGLVVYVLVARPRGLLGGTLATVPATAALIVVAYHANLLDTLDPTTPAAVSQGHTVALAAVICACACACLRLLFALALDPRLRRLSGGRLLGPRAARAALAGGVVASLLVVLALGVPHALANDWNRFISGAKLHGKGVDLRQRLSDPSSDGRIDLWRVALRGFSSSPLHGHGAGMYQTLWDRRRPSFAYTINAHSLYLQALAELGVPGLALLAIVVGAVLVGLAVRARGRARSLHGALLAAAVVWAVHAGVDWDWEMPVITLGFFAAAGLALGPRRQARRGWSPGWGVRTTLALACLAGIALPVLIVGWQRDLGEAERALYASDCAVARPAAQASLRWLDVSPEPYEIVGFCDLERGHTGQALAAMRAAVRRDPEGWEPYYALAIAQASAGVDPRAAVERALRMNPHEPLTRQAVKELRTSKPGEWVRRSSVVRAAALASNDLSIVPS